MSRESRIKDNAYRYREIIKEAKDKAKEISGELVLTDNERALILKRREEAEEVKRKKALVLKRLMVASDFAQYVDKHDCDRSYSTFCTFCDDFGYKGAEGENEGRTWGIVTILMDTAERES